MVKQSWIKLRAPDGRETYRLMRNLGVKLWVGVCLGRLKMMVVSKSLMRRPMRKWKLSQKMSRVRMEDRVKRLWALRKRRLNHQAMSQMRTSPGLSGTFVSAVTRCCVKWKKIFCMMRQT